MDARTPPEGGPSCERDEAPIGAIGAFLRDPEAVVDLEGLVAAFKMRTIQLRVGGAAAHAADPLLCGRVRGALGDLLAASASPESRAGQPCPWSPPCAFEALFRKQGRMRPGVDFPSPWVICAEEGEGDLLLSLRLFGIACEWAPAVAETLVLAVDRHLGWAAGTGAILDRQLIAADGLAIPDLGAEGAQRIRVDLDFRSPAVCGRGGEARDPAVLFTGLRHRIEGLARWHGLTVAPSQWPPITRAVRALEVRWAAPRALSWRRGSRRQDRWVPMSGVAGLLRLAGRSDDLAPLAPLLALGAEVHVGADIAFGCGRYRLTPAEAF
ncbi:CRISPR system precrRNA processing endoribonuclease RAMP protein Cas6 [Xanthobacter sp. AM11]|uniref:CRISPR system precrRNA processing endoribonuclease RAMP protein Cas6 n=1 Tax=Xanthobacter sp. AM11 TaxID=3380643 RepID=UPI0039BF18B3